MEVDDSVNSSPAEESESPDATVHGGHRSRLVARRKRPKTVPPMGKKEEFGEFGAHPEQSDGGSNYSETSLKLVMSVTEEENSQDNSALAKLELSKEVKILAKLLIKRKRYEIQKTSSNEWLLGFDEQTGIAEFSKNDVSKQRKRSQVEKPRASPSSSPHPAKRFKSSSPSKGSPKTVIELPKQHIVADNEEVNGGVTANDFVLPSAEAASPKKTNTPEGFFKKPFEYGWKRELVLRANNESSKDKADVYFISPSGKKLRTKNEIIPLLDGDLTIEHFSFTREPLGVSSEYETVRYAKATRITAAAATLAAAPQPSSIGKRISKPKVPKGASPPPQGWTPTRALKVNNAALLNVASSSKHTSPSSNTPQTPTTSRGISMLNFTIKNKGKKVTATAASIATEKSTNVAHKHCTNACARAPGQVPQLQCIKCVRLYHHECVGLNRHNCEYRTITSAKNAGAASGREYICEGCLSSESKAPTTSNFITRITKIETKLPQTIAVLKGKKYVVVTKPNPPRNEYSSDIENDLKQINDSMRNNRQFSVGNSSPQPNTVAVATSDNSNRQFASNFFANVSYAYDALIWILKFLKIHERPRAAAVCKLWNLAAKDTSLWHTVRMKNSKVQNWAGFSAALRRGETKHMDLRKMLLANSRSDEMWQEFSKYIGTVCSLESIDLCRCSTQVVENLFKSNSNLRVLNAIAISVPSSADTGLNLEHIGLMENLEELRLRTCEPCGIEGDLQPLESLVKLTQLSLTAVRGLGAKNVEILAKLTQLRSLELGECGDLDGTLAETVLLNLQQLQRLRLENGQETACCTLGILEAVASMKQLKQLELVNFDIKPGFDDKLSKCLYIRKLLIIPTYISQSATTNNIVLNAVQQVAETLKVFTWGVTVELLRVTALYVDQCEESTKKERHHFDECIPVLKPVPGAPVGDDENEETMIKPDEEQKSSDVPQIEILPLEKVESILSDNLRNTKFSIVKVPYLGTCKQQLVE